MSRFGAAVFADDWTANWNQPTQNSTVTTASGAQVPYNLAPNNADGSAPMANTTDANGNPVYYPGNVPGTGSGGLGALLSSLAVPLIGVGVGLVLLAVLSSSASPFHGRRSRRSRR